MYEDGIRKLDDGRYAVTYEIKDIDYTSLSDEDKELMLDSYAMLLNSFPASSMYKFTLCKRRINKKHMLSESLLQTDNKDGYDNLRLAFNRLRFDDINGDEGYVINKYLTISSPAKNINVAQTGFARNAGDIRKRLMMINSGLRMLDASEYGEIIYDFLNAGRESAYNYTYNAGDIRDYVTADAVRFRGSYFETGDKVGRVMMLKTLGSSISDNFLNDFMETDTNIILSEEIIPLTKAEAKRLIELKDDSVEGNADAWSEKKKVREGSAQRLPRYVKNDRKIVDEYIEDMNNNNKMFLVTITVAFLADTLDELKNITETIYDTAEGSTSQMCICYSQQAEGLQTCLPFGVRRLQNLRDFTTDTLAGMMIFDRVRFNHRTGIPFGKNEGTKQQVMVDVRKLMEERRLLNGHTWVFGKSGGGKSMNVKLKSIYQALLTDADIVWVDVDGECGKMINALGGQTVHVGIDSINVADILLDWGDADNPIDPVKDSISNVTNFVQRALNENIGNVEKSLIDRSMRRLYKGVTDGYAADVTLRDLYDVLSLADEPEANRLALAIERFVIGSFNCFSKPTSVNINSRIICYDLSTLDEQTKILGMDVVLDHIERRLINNRRSGRTTYIYLEEMDYHLTHQDTLLRIKGFYERARKYGGCITGIIQNATRVLQVQEAHTMLLNAEIIIMHRQEKDDAYELARMYDLSAIQLKTLLTAEPGHGINKIGDIIYTFDCSIPEDNELYGLVNTD